MRNLLQDEDFNARTEGDKSGVIKCFSLSLSLCPFIKIVYWPICKPDWVICILLQRLASTQESFNEISLNSNFTLKLILWVPTFPPSSFWSDHSNFFLLFNNTTLILFHAFYNQSWSLGIFLTKFNIIKLKTFVGNTPDCYSLASCVFTFENLSNKLNNINMKDVFTIISIIFIFYKKYYTLYNRKYNHGTK